MVTRKELSEYKQTLTSALQKEGYTAFGRISSSEDAFNTYAHLPEQEMVAQYVEDNNLDEINRIYRVIRFISDNSGSYYSLKNLCKEHGIDYKLFNHALETLPYIDKTGERRKTQYHWIYEEEPSFSTAKDIAEYLRKLKYTKLNKRLKEKIKRAVTQGVSKEDFFNVNNIKKEATYHADGYYTYLKMQQQKKDAPEEIREAVPEPAPEPELPQVNEETELQDPGSINGKHELEEEEPQTLSEELQPQPEDHDDASLQMENYILRQEIKYLRKINKAKDKLIRALRERG